MSESGAEKQLGEQNRDDIPMPHESSKVVDREMSDKAMISARADSQDHEELARMISEIQSGSSGPSKEICETLLRAFADRTLSDEANRVVASMIDRNKNWSDAYERIVVQRAAERPNTNSVR